MPTASTKQRARKKERAAKRGSNSLEQPSEAEATDAGAAATETVEEPEINERVWKWGSAAVLLVATFLRCFAIELKPLHHDEGVNAFFLTRLLREGIYAYDPANYHGPTLYYLTLPLVYLSGLNTIAIRLVPVLFGIATVWLVLCLRRYIGTVGALAAAALLAVSPGAVYQSRYFIHESLFVFFALGIVVASLWFYKTPRAVYLLLAAVSAAFLFATKETAFISAGVLIMATLVAWGYAYLMGGSTAAEAFAHAGRSAKPLRAKDVRKRSQATESSDILERLGGAERLALLVLAAVVLFVFINVLFYSSFFTHPKGIGASLETFKIWTKTGSTDHTKPIYEYVKWLMQEEAPILLLAFVGALLSLLRRGRNRFAVFAGAWAFGTLAAYSIIRYKTPWLMLNFIVPLAIIGGYGVNTLAGWGKGEATGRIPVVIVVGLALVICSYQTVKLNFYHYDNDRYPYVYAHTRREFLDLVNEVERLAARAGTGKETPIGVASPDYWPLPWYLREYKRVGFPGRVGTLTEPIIIANESQLPQLLTELQTPLGSNHQRVGEFYELRPGVRLVLVARRDLVRR